MLLNRWLIYQLVEIYLFIYSSMTLRHFVPRPVVLSSFLSSGRITGAYAVHFAHPNPYGLCIPAKR